MEHRRIVGDVPALAIWVAGGVLALGWLAFQTISDRSDEQGRRALGDEAGPAVGDFTHDLGSLVAGAAGITPNEPVRGISPAARVVRSGGEYALDGPRTRVVAPADLEPASSLITALDEARDVATPVVVTGRFGINPRPAALVVIPEFAEGVAPASTAGRRAALAGLRVAVLDLDRLLDSSFAGLDAAVEVRTGDLVLARRATVGATGARLVWPVTSGNGPWTVTVTRPLPGRPAAAWAALGAGAALAGAILMAAARRNRMFRRAREEADARADQSALMAELGPILQSSLDLSEMLPGLALRLAEGLGLSEVRIDVVGLQGGRGGVFSHQTGAAERGRTPTGLVASTIPLRRGGRALGSLTVTARRPLAPTTRQALEAVAELVAGAVANAAAFEAEQATVNRLNELDRLKTEFLGTVSHELRTPLTAIVGFAHMLEAGLTDLDPDDARDYVRRINRNASSLASLLQQILDFARLEREQLKVAVVEMDLVETARRAIESVGPLTDQHEVELVAPEACAAWSDPVALERVLANLLTNAVKFSPEGSTVRVTLTESGTDAILAVEDAGPGVPADDRTRIFERFYRGTSESALRTRGAGIGLAVVKELLTRLGGSVEAGESAMGGACFTVVLPGALDGRAQRRPDGDRSLAGRQS